MSTNAMKNPAHYFHVLILSKFPTKYPEPREPYTRNKNTSSHACPPSGLDKA